MLVAQVVDPEVSRAKFDREVAAYRQLEATYQKRGWLLLRGEIPRSRRRVRCDQATPGADSRRRRRGFHRL